MANKIEKVVYRAHAKSTGGRDGTTRTSDGLLDLKLAVPKEMGGAGGGVNPEQLFLPLTLSEDDGNLSSGKSGGETYALPLWYEENVLSVPNGWLEEDGTPTVTVQPHSLLGQTAATPKPETDETPSIPWRRLLAENALWVSPGTAGPQLAFTAPSSLRKELDSAALH